MPARAGGCARACARRGPRTHGRAAAQTRPRAVGGAAARHALALGRSRRVRAATEAGARGREPPGPQAAGAAPTTAGAAPTAPPNMW
jgi:hypothetical protein